MYNLGSKIIGHLQKVDNLVNGIPQFPITCEIDPTNRCQNDCKWCIYANYIKGNRVDLDYNLYLKVLQQLKKGGCKSITFTGGGEPLLHKDIIKMIVIAYQLGFKLGLITNGVSLNKILPILDHFTFIRISLDATNPKDYKKLKGTNFFKRVTDNIKEAVELKNTDIGISMVYEQGMKKEAQLFPALGERLGVKYAQVKPIVDKGIEVTSNEMKSIKNGFITERYLINKDYLPCKLAGLIGQVAADGCFYYCCIHRGIKKYKIGDLSKNSLKSIIDKRAKFIPDLDDCSSCRYMNYVKEFEKVRNDKFSMLRHIDFL